MDHGGQSGYRGAIAHKVRLNRSRGVGVLTVGVFLASLVAGALSTSTGVEAASSKITICHRTHSTTNPYRKITVSQNAVQNTRHGGHGLPVGSANPPVFSSTFTYAPNNKYWGDIIPGGDAEGLPFNGTNPIAKNWTTAGKADFFGTYCGAMAPTDFYNAEIAAGQLPADVIADLNEQAANEDLALLAALGGSFTLANLASWNTAVTVTTNAATQTTSASATLNGSLTVGTTSTLPNFQYGTSPTLATTTPIAATPSPVTGTTAVTALLTGLTPSTVYYFMVTGTTNAGTDTEGILVGAIMSFTTAASDATTTSTTTTVTPTTSSSSSTTTVDPTSSTSTSTTVDPTSSTSTSTTVDPTSSTSTSTTVAPTTTSSTTTTVAPTTSTSTSTTTTVAPTPSTSTTTSSVPSPGPSASPTDGSVQGVVWFDRNGNGAFDGNEWVLPGVTVIIEEAGASTSQALHLEAAPLNRTAVTAADGSYFFGSLTVGAYRVTAQVSLNGFDYTSDTDGLTDWIVAVNVVAQATATADFAGIGHGEIIGQVFDATTLQGVAGASIQCSWSGFDDVLGNQDDIVFNDVADETGSFDMAGVPYGFFSCVGLDPLTSRQSSPAAATVFAVEAVRAPLPLATDATANQAFLSGTLPRTGDDSSSSLWLAFFLVAAGAGTTAMARRRKV